MEAAAKQEDAETIVAETKTETPKEEVKEETAAPQEAADDSKEKEAN
jgi:hypothetical protein